MPPPTHNIARYAELADAAGAHRVTELAATYGGASSAAAGEARIAAEQRALAAWVLALVRERAGTDETALVCGKPLLDALMIAVRVSEAATRHELAAATLARQEGSSFGVGGEAPTELARALTASATGHIPTPSNQFYELEDVGVNPPNPRPPDAPRGIVPLTGPRRKK